MNTPAPDNGTPPPPPPGPLNGVRILDLATVYAAPITAMLRTTALTSSRSDHQGRLIYRSCRIWCVSSAIQSTVSRHTGPNERSRWDASPRTGRPRAG
jgi:hypothetical protein